MSLEIYTDGSCIKKNNISYGGYGIHFPNKELNDISEELKLSIITNQRAELYAILIALQIATKQDINKIIIYSDSMYSINCVTIWYIKWIQNDWKTCNNQNVINKDIISKILNIIQNFKSNNTNTNDIQFIHVKSHTCNEGNNIADKLAYNACIKSVK